MDAKAEFIRKYGWVDSRDYDAFIDALVNELGI
jgi:hypothetical protein